MNKLNRYEDFALGQYLSIYPGDITYDEIIQALLDGENYIIVVWEAFENHPIEEVVRLIDDLKEALEDTFIPRVQELNDETV